MLSLLCQSLLARFGQSWEHLFSWRQLNQPCWLQFSLFADSRGGLDLVCCGLVQLKSVRLLMQLEGFHLGLTICLASSVVVMPLFSGLFQTHPFALLMQRRWTHAIIALSVSVGTVPAGGEHLFWWCQWVWPCWWPALIFPVCQLSGRA